MQTFSEQLSESYTNLIDKGTDWLNLVILQIPNFILAAVVCTIAYLVSGYVKKLAVKGFRRFTSNKTVLELTGSLATAIFGVLVLFIALGILNLGETINKILATAGVLGLAIGLALQEPMNNLFSGVFMSVRDLFNIGDLVETNGFFGTITKIDLRATTLKLPTGQLVTIPNKDVIQSPLTNYTEAKIRRVEISCGVSYGEDLDFVERVAVDAMAEVEEVLSDEPIDLVFEEFGGSSINFKLRFWMDISGQRDFLLMRSNAIKALKAAFDEHDIMIPFPIRTLDFGIKGGVPIDEMITQENQLQNQANSD
jgi:small conductance mechanosensitive channel